MVGSNSYGNGSVYGGAPSYQGQGQSSGKVYGGGTMPTDLGNPKQGDQATYLGSAVSSIGGAVVGAGSYVASGASYLGLWKGGSPNKKSLAEQQYEMGSSSSYYNPPGGTFTGSEDIMRES